MNKSLLNWLRLMLFVVTINVVILIPIAVIIISLTSILYLIWSLTMNLIINFIKLTAIFTMMLLSQFTLADVGSTQAGKASWYGPGFHGKRTASGERYNMYAMTAAHRSLPFGTTVRVTNTKNGHSVVLKINDRGPYKKGRIIDLSKSANSKLKCNLCNVEVEVLSIGDGKYRKR